MKIFQKKKLDWSWVRRNSMSEIWRSPIGWYEGVAQKWVLSEGWHRANFIFPSWRDDASKVFLEYLQSEMNLNRAVNCLYISLDGQILKKVIRWQQNVLRIALRNLYYVISFVMCESYLQSKKAADSRELINRKFDSCQVNLRRSFLCTTVIPIYLNMTFESHRWQTFLALTICRNDLPK